MTDPAPSFEDLVSFASGEMAATDAAAMAEHLRSPEMAGTVVQLRRVFKLLGADDLEAVPDEVRRGALDAFVTRPAVSAISRWLEATERLVATLVFDSRSEASLVGLRGAATSDHLAYDSEAGRLDLQVIPPPPIAGGPHRVRGQFDSTGAAPSAVALVRPGVPEPVAVTEPDAFGSFELAVRPGVYELLVRLEEGPRTIVVPGVEVRGQEA